MRRPFGFTVAFKVALVLVMLVMAPVRDSRWLRRDAV